MPLYAASSRRTATVIAERRHAADEEVAARAWQHAGRVRAALVAAGSELDTVLSGHYPSVEMPEVVADRFERWVGS
jgi:hypothetical protein